MFKRILFVIVSLQLVMVFPAIAELIITCGPSDGYAYYPPQGLVPREKSGWTPDKISTGATSLVRNGDKFDILFKDVRGMSSASTDGGAVTLIGIAGTNVVVSVQYQGVSIEVYTFDLKSKTLLWSQHKYGAIINKAATFRSKCQ